VRTRYKILPVNLQAVDHSKVVDMGGKIVLKWSLNRYGKGVLIGFILLRIYIRYVSW
jgi:hypothetical protein